MIFALEESVIAAITEDKVIGCGHVDPLLTVDTLSEAVEKCIEKLTPHTGRFTTVAVSGYSSTIIGSIVASRMKKHICIVRKPNDDCHSPFLVEGKPMQKYVFIDDLIASGSTLRRVVDSMKTLHSDLYGVYVYLNDPYDMRNKLDRIGKEVKYLNEA